MIRDVIHSDYEQVIKIIKQVHDFHFEHRPDIFLDYIPMSREYFMELINSDDYIFLVELENNVVAGVLIASKVKTGNKVIKSRTTYYIEDIVVDEMHRKKGIGKRLYNHLLNMAKNNNIDAIELNVWSFNEGTIKFYESIGLTVKNMKLENFLSNSDIVVNKREISITESVK